jgi:CTP synthase (UTP-ammonia lyase)
MEKFAKNLSLLKKLSMCCNTKRQKIIENTDLSLVHCICECIHNVLNGTVKLSRNKLEKLRKYKSVLRKLNQKNSIKHKKKLIIQNGGFLQYLIPAIIPLITSLVEKLI